MKTGDRYGGRMKIYKPLKYKLMKKNYFIFNSTFGREYKLLTEFFKCRCGQTQGIHDENI